MKVKTLLEEINRKISENPDFINYDVYTEQPDLWVPPFFKKVEDLIDEKRGKENYSYSKEEIEIYKNSKKRMEELELLGVKFVTDSEGWVYRDTPSIIIENSETNEKQERGFFTCFDDKKIFTINNNY